LLIIISTIPFQISIIINKMFPTLTFLLAFGIILFLASVAQNL
jgi:hypothetical protein